MICFERTIAEVVQQAKQRLKFLVLRYFLFLAESVTGDPLPEEMLWASAQ